jgi:hypothetical protein
LLLLDGLPLSLNAQTSDDEENGGGSPRKKAAPVLLSCTRLQFSVEFMRPFLLTDSKVVDYENRTIEQIYQKKTQLEHILLRPDTYIGMTPSCNLSATIALSYTCAGAVTEQEAQMWVYDEVRGGSASESYVWYARLQKKGMVFRNIRYVPGLYKIFDEILVNAADNKQRDPDGESWLLTQNVCLQSCFSSFLVRYGHHTGWHRSRQQHHLGA